MRKLVSALALCASVAALAACGDSAGVSAASYVKSVCNTAVTWRNAIVHAGQRLQSALTSTSLPQTKSDYVDFVGTVKAATGHAADQLAAAGTPSVSNGKSIASTLVRTFNQARDSLSRAESEARAIPTDNKSTFNAAAGKVQTDVRNALAQMSSVTPANNAQLRKAAANDPTCKRLASAG
jgi:hypothetical protein